MMKSGLLMCGVLLAVGFLQADVIIQDGVKAWKDRGYLVSGFPADLKLKKAVPEQACDGYLLQLPKGAKRALIGVFASEKSRALAAKSGWIALGKSFKIGTAAQPAKLTYDLYIVENPPEKLDLRATSAGGILLALDDEVPAAPPTPAPAAAAAVAAATVTAWRGLAKMQKFPGQEYRFRPGAREVEMYVREPAAGVNADTGMMLVSHNWGGTWKLTAPWCDVLSDKFNLICISVNYLQSGETKHGDVPYDHGVLQAMDCLRALYVVRRQLDAAGVAYHKKRIYAAGASGGGNVSLMVNKLAPASFAGIVDMCGMPGLTDDIAFGRGRLNAGYSRDAASPKFLTMAMREIRDPGHPGHLTLQKQVNPDNQVVIVHGLDDDYCAAADKIRIFENMVRAGFHPAGHFLVPADVDGTVVTGTGHAIGDRPQVIVKFGGAYMAPTGPYVRQLAAPSNFDTGKPVILPVTGGRYVVDFSAMPEIRFEKL